LFTGVFSKGATIFFISKTNTVWDINEILYFCECEFDAIMYETRLILNGHHGNAFRSPDAEHF